RLVQRAKAAMRASPSAPASSTTASGLPSSGSVLNTLTWRKGRVDTDHSPGTLTVGAQIASGKCTDYCQAATSAQATSDKQTSISPSEYMQNEEPLIRGQPTKRAG